MWKAIVWGFAGLLLGVVLGGPMGAALGAILGTLIGSVAGALHFHHHRSRAVCEPKRSGPSLLQVAGVVTGVAVGVALIHMAVVVAAAAAVVVVIVAGLALATRLLRDRLSVVHWPALQQQAARPEVQLRALPAPPLAIEAPRTAPAWDNGTPATGGMRVAVPERAAASDDVDDLQGVLGARGAPGSAPPRRVARLAG